MTTPLAPCPACHRHLRVDASVCPFCAAPVDARATTEARSRIAAHVSRAAIIAMGSLAAVGCSSPSASDGTIAQPYGAPPTPARLNWMLTPSESAIKMADRAKFRLTIAVTNTRNFVTDPERGSVSFKVNGQPAPAVDLAFQNGTQTPDWKELPPNNTATDARDIGEALFPAPGTYVIELVVDGDSVAQVSVTVSAQ